MPLRRCALVTLLALALPSASSATAQERERTRPGAGSVLDRAVPERASARRVLLEARARLLAALGPRDSIDPAWDVVLEQAIMRYDLVVRVRPDDVDAWLERGLALAHFQRTMPDGRIDRRIDEAIESLERARALDPAREAAWVASQLAVLRTQQGDYARAATEYEAAMRAETPYPTPVGAVSTYERIALFWFVPSEAPTLLGNWAEVTMLSGDARGAIELYRRAYDAAPRGSVSAALALWGLALAEERAGDHGDALLDAARAIDAAPADYEAARDAAALALHGAFAPLHLSGVFFEPACEIHAYEALGHEALAARATNEEARTSELLAALRSARYFLAEGGRRTIFGAIGERAEARLAELASERGRP